ncbi:hypothetical protein [Leptospira santarosai]|uniref:Uncharacterized protein n=1 Tax=Leptospira santarosai TaxID=28183 RepID=A0AB73NDZ3_9LEPT|nr:hypothetical protein [Leptospira santarosai]OLY64968.1 hypothetical protein BWD11_05925 [Leptospira santarosai serovar Grippotyphosa]ONF76505.1 hypothetical protein BWD12_18450 [Leptospira santarosai serovar Bananal]ASV11235.1 hypothetical protein B2G51_05035 [Leptospira santarosai]AVV49927.1 Glycosyl transferase [Leptospira santarosai]MDI7192227.1 hypothetical protein [Leptospira santarosai]
MLLLAHTFIINEEISLGLYILIKYIANFWIANRLRKYYEVKNETITIQAIIVTISDYLYFPIVSHLELFNIRRELPIILTIYALLKGIIWAIIITFFIKTEIEEKDNILDKISSWGFGVFLSIFLDLAIAVPVILVGFYFQSL